jgi:UDP-glucose 4-epimerase
VKISGNKFVVTGGAGFIGSQVVKSLLKAGASEVVIFDNLSRGSLNNINESLKDDRCYLFKDGGDIRDVELLNAAFSNANGVFHLAALWLLHAKDYPRAAFDVNVQGTFNVLEACVKNEISKVVFSSSASVYGTPIKTPIEESHPLNGRNFYGSTKIAGESMFTAFYDRYGIKFVGLRYMNVYGEFQDQKGAYSGVIPNIFNNIFEKQVPVIFGDGTQTYDFITSFDVARANLLAMESDIEEGFFNVGTGVPTTIKGLCNEIYSLFNLEPVMRFIPYSKVDLRQLVQHRVGSTTKAKEELKFMYQESLRVGLLKLLKWRIENDLN